jgi:hypothetical protein
MSASRAPSPPRPPARPRRQAAEHTLARPPTSQRPHRARPYRPPRTPAPWRERGPPSHRSELSENRSRKVSDLVATFKVTSETRFPTKVFSKPTGLPAATFAALVGKWTVTTASGNPYYYNIGKDKTVTWAVEPEGNDGGGKLLSAGGGMLEMAWTDGSIDLWDVTSVASGAATGFYYYADDTIRLTAVKT